MLEWHDQNRTGCERDRRRRVGTLRQPSSDRCQPERVLPTAQRTSPVREIFVESMEHACADG